MSTNNEHNKRMLNSSVLLRSTYRNTGNDLMDDRLLHPADYFEYQDILLPACRELDLQLEADELIANNEINRDFDLLIEAIYQASGGNDFLVTTKQAINFIEDKTRVRFV